MSCEFRHPLAVVLDMYVSVAAREVLDNYFTKVCILHSSIRDIEYECVTAVHDIHVCCTRGNSMDTSDIKQAIVDKLNLGVPQYIRAGTQWQYGYLDVHVLHSDMLAQPSICNTSVACVDITLTVHLGVGW